MVVERAPHLSPTPRTPQASSEGDVTSFCRQLPPVSAGGETFTTRWEKIIIEENPVKPHVIIKAGSN